MSLTQVLHGFSSALDNVDVERCRKYAESVGYIGDLSASFNDAELGRQQIVESIERITSSWRGKVRIKFPHVNKTRSEKSNKAKGRRAFILSERWSPRNRRSKKWQKVAAECGAILVVDWPIQPVEHIKLDFDILPTGAVFK